MLAVIALDLGGTLIRAGVVGEDREVLHYLARPVGDRRGNAAIGALIREVLHEVHRWAASHATPTAAVGLALPGLVDAGRGTIRFSANLDVRHLEVADLAREALRLPVHAENDVRAAAWAEWLWGAGQGAQDIVYISAGTGIAAAVIADGRLYRGAHWAAGEVGHVPVVKAGEPCRCGGRGCLETVAGGWGIADRARQMAARLGTPLPVADEAVTAEAVFLAARAGHPAAAAAIEAAGAYLARAAVTIVRLWDPDRVVLGGGLLHPGSPLVSAVQREIASCALPGQAAPAVMLSRFQDRAGLIGAACLVTPGPGRRPATPSAPR